ncbi:MAG: trehalose-phosphatase [Proteobacteria bacterium]|nr:trehalose-phosphatase [Pseudomonadota bacterium]
MDGLSPLRADRVALFLDLDGSIVPFGRRPERVRASLACRIVLKRAVETLRGRVAIVSGRTIASVDKVLSRAVDCVAGVHGLQRRDPMGSVFLTPPHARVEDAAAVLEALARAHAGLLVERKGPSVAIHFRGAPQAQAAVCETVERLAAASGLETQYGHLVAELRTPGPDKGAAIRRFMLEPPFRGAVPLFLGDDLTDEAGFAEAASQGGAGILVGPARKSAAVARLDSPAAALGWIVRSLDAGAFDLEDAAWVA